MNRPTRRKSSLSGANPVAPTESAPGPAATSETGPAELNPASTTTTTRNVETRPKPQRKYPPKVSFYQDPEDTARVRGAILHTMTTEGSRSLSQFIDRAVMAEVVRLEAKYNGGKPFPPVGARELPQGRPMGE